MRFLIDVGDFASGLGIRVYDFCEYQLLNILLIYTKI